MKVLRDALIALGIVVLFFVYLLRPHANAAEKEALAIINDLSSLNPISICTNGDSGYGIDNRVPWYTAYVEVDTPVNLEETVNRVAKSHGYVLAKDEDTINGLQGLPVASRNGGTMAREPGGEE